MASKTDSQLKYFGGIEGGGSCSNMVVIDSRGEIVGTSKGLGTNPWLVPSIDECAEIINNMVVEAKKMAGIENQPLCSLGLSLSGGESSSKKGELTQKMQEKYPNCSSSYFICTDTFGSIAVASESGGVVLISGTGSNCQLVNPKGDVHGCGGWGHMLGDEASGYWISHKAIKTVFDDIDGLMPSPHDITFVKGAMFEYFKMKKLFDILPHLYKDFSKANVARFTTDLAKGASNQQDPLCKHVFHEAGVMLGRHIFALEAKIDEELIKSGDGLKVLCVGSVFQSWDLLKEGFILGLKDSKLKSVILLKSKVRNSVGAAILGAKSISQRFPVDYSKNTETFFTYTAHGGKI